MSEHRDNNGPRDAGRLLKCGDIRGVLFDYMTRELGPSRSELVREHLRRCVECQREAAEIRETLDLLQAASQRGKGAAGVLSEDRRRRLARACMHPVLDWVYEHHVLVSVLVAALVIAVSFARLLRTRLWSIDPPPPGFTVTIGEGKRPAGTNAPPVPARQVSD